MLIVLHFQRIDMALFLNLQQHLQHQRRNNLRRDRIFRDRLHPLDAYNDIDLVRRYRLSRHVILELHDLIDAELEPTTHRNHAVPAILQIFCTLRYYATGTFQSVIGQCHGLHRSTTGRIIKKVTDAICHHRRRFISFPRNDNARQVQIKQEFYDIAGMPNCLGAIDRTLMLILAPHIDEHLYVSRKGGHCMNILAICDGKLKFTYVVAKFPGSSHES